MQEREGFVANATDPNPGRRGSRGPEKAWAAHLHTMDGRQKNDKNRVKNGTFPWNSVKIYQIVRNE